MFLYFTFAVPKLIEWIFFVVDAVPISTEIGKIILLKFFLCVEYTLKSPHCFFCYIKVSEPRGVFDVKGMMEMRWFVVLIFC